MNGRDWVICLITGGIFLSLSLWNISLPGLQYDECNAAAPAVNFLSNAPKTEPMQIDQSVVHVAGRPLPVMLMTYIGPVKTIMHIPFFVLLGVSPLSVRLLPVFIVLLCFPLAYYVCLRLFDQTVAWFTVMLMAVDPSFVFYLTRDVGPSALQVFLKLFSLFSFLQWWHQQKKIFFYAGMFAWGLAVTHKVDFFWVIGGIALAAFMVSSTSFLRRVDHKVVLVGILCFLVGALPIVVFNIVTGGLTFAPLVSKILGISAEPTYSFLSSLVVRLHQIFEIQNGNFISLLFTENMIYGGAWKHVYTLVLLLSFLWFVASPLFKPRLQQNENVIGVWIFIITVLVASCFSPTVLNGHHMLALSPALHVVVAVFLTSIANLNIHLRRFKIDAIVVLFLVVFTGYSCISINRVLARTGGTGFWSDAIYDLGDYLEKKNMPIAAMDWGFTNNLIVVSKGTLSIKRVYAEAWKQSNLQETIASTLNDTTLYLFHSQEYTVNPSLHDAFAHGAGLKGYTLTLEKEFYQRDGRKVYVLYRLQRVS